MINSKEILDKARDHMLKLEEEENRKKEIILEYLNKNRFFNEKELLAMLKDIIAKEIEPSLSNYKKSLIEKNEDKETMDALLKKEEKSLQTYMLRMFLIPILKNNRILLEPMIASDQIVILRDKEAEFFVFIFHIYKNDSNILITKTAIEEAKRFLNIKTEELDSLITEGILHKYGSEKMRSKINCIDRRDVYENQKLEDIIFINITVIKINKEVKLMGEKINESNIKINQSNEKIEESSERIKEAEEKIGESNKRIEKGKIDTVSLLGIFVAIISIIYANISVSISNELSSVVITNISTVVCILFLLGFIEKSIKNENNKIPIVIIWGISLFMSLILIIGMYSYMRYEKNNFIKYIENIYELKNKETTLELQHFTMPSDY